MGPELGHPDDVVVGDGDNEPMPIEVARVQARPMDKLRDGHLIPRGVAGRIAARPASVITDRPNSCAAADGRSGKPDTRPA